MDKKDWNLGDGLRKICRQCAHLAIYGMMHSIMQRPRGGKSKSRTVSKTEIVVRCRLYVSC